MKLTSLNLFPTLVLHAEDFLSPIQCKDIIACALKYCNFSTHGAVTNDSKSSHIYNNGPNNNVEIHNKIVEMPHCKGFIMSIMDLVNEYEKTTGIYGGRKIGNSWINIQTKGSRLNRHTHPGSFLSGAIYLNVDDDSSKIYFHNPNPFNTINSVLEETAYSTGLCSVKPKIGDLVLFPSWLSHDSGPDLNQTDNRTVLAFNTF